MAKVRLLDPSDSKRRLDRYELIGELASGGMATVYLGRLGGVGGFQRFVAIKRLHPHLASEEEFIEMFLDEARLAAGIHHPHVVPILEVGESDSGYYLVMEYVEGDTLARLMARSLARAQPIPRPVLIRIVLDALAGLHAAHELIDGDGTPVQLVHRDVSPQNVLVGVDGCSRITDFGVAHAASRLQNTRADRLKGKLAYMSPEQARAGDIDRRADVFAMGIILWEVLAAKRLFKSESEAVTLQRVTVEPIPRLASVVPGIHPALDHVCACALDRDRNRRYRSAADFAEALERAARDAATSSPTDLGVASPREVAAYMQGALGEDIAAQRESVRAWLSHGEPSLPRAFGTRPGEVAKPPTFDVTMQFPLDRPPTHGGVTARVASVETPTPIAYQRARLGSPQPPPPAPAMEESRHAIPHMSAPQGVTPMPSSAPEGISRVRVGSAPDTREPPSVRRPAPLLSADGASLDEPPVEPRDDDDDDHETLLMDRETALAELMRSKGIRAPEPADSRSSAPTPVPLPPDLPSSFFSETQSRSIDSFMVPARPPPSRTPQLVALVIALLIGVGGLVVWWQLRGEDASSLPSVNPGSIGHNGGDSLHAAAPPLPVTTALATAPTMAPAIPLSALPPANPAKLKGKMPKGKSSASPVEPASTVQVAAPPTAPLPPPPDLPKPDDLANPYR